MEKKGTLELLCGPSGVGKSTSFEKKKAYTYTTRDKRDKETHGIDRYFVSEDEFNQLLTRGVIVAPYKALGKQYGFAAELKEVLQNGEHVAEQIVPYEAIDDVVKAFEDSGRVIKKLFLAFPDLLSAIYQLNFFLRAQHR